MKFHLQLSKVYVGGVEGEADGEAELGVHQQSHLVLSLLHGSLLRLLRLLRLRLLRVQTHAQIFQFT